MHYPHFSLAVLGRSSIHEDPTIYEEKPITIYEFEFYTEDWAGGTLTDGVFRPARKGGYCLFKPGQMQKLIPPYRCYVMNIRAEDPELKAVLDSMPTFSMLWNMDKIIDLLRQMLAIGDRTAMESRLQLQSYISQILAHLLAHSQTPERMDPSLIRHQGNLLAVDRYIRKNLDKDLSLKRLAQQSNLDPTYFHKLFTAAFGQTPAKQVLHYRIAAVKEGLLDENLSLDALAEQCGFSSPSYLGTKFRQVTGMTLTQYRKDILEKL